MTAAAPIVCVGWISLDVIGHVDAFPTAQAHARAGDFDAACGGRAASQAMAISAVEGSVSLVARIGSDTNAELLQAELIELGIDADNVLAAPAPTGMRMVAEQPDGQQLAVVFAGANDYLTVDDLNRRSELFAAAAVVGVTAEPAGAVLARALELARAGDARTVLTHTPGAQLSDRVLAAADVLVVSASGCAGVLDPGMTQERPAHAARVLVQRGARNVVVLTSRAAILADADGARELPSPTPLDAEDATDAFAAGLITGLAEGESIEHAMARGVRVAGLLVE
jgi:sugar/nucleoside kinase (ribokinase family)